MCKTFGDFANSRLILFLKFCIFSCLEGKTVEYALVRFTAQEQLRGSNSYECENCCVPVNKKEGKRHKTVNAQKKYLLYSLPPVLTLHMKRFEKVRSAKYCEYFIIYLEPFIQSDPHDQAQWSYRFPNDFGRCTILFQCYWSTFIFNGFLQFLF